MTEKRRQAERARDKRRYWARRNDGMCGKCGKRFAEAGRALCRICYAKRDEYVARTDPDGVLACQRVKRLTDERRAKGLCVDCGNRLTDKRFSRCAACRKRRREYEQVARIRARIQRESAVGGDGR